MTTSAIEAANHTRYRAGQTAGHYESFFVRANHPSRPLAFWIRYTIFSPQQRPDLAVGELWAVSFDGEAGRHVAVKKEVPFSSCTFSSSAFLVRVGDSRLEAGALEGSAATGAHTISWNLSYRLGSHCEERMRRSNPAGVEGAPLFLLPPRLYETGFPKAKSLVGAPLAAFDGVLQVDGDRVDVQRWVGSQNHNWGSKHTDHYAWAQIAGFDTHPESFLEVATARLKVGPFWTPFMTTLVLRHRGEEFALNSLRQMLRARGSFSHSAPPPPGGSEVRPSWRFSSENDDVRVEGTIQASRDAFVGLRYANPPGGIKHCLNSKIASCELTVTDKRRGAAPEQLTTAHRAAFEILTDERDHGIEMRV